MSIDNSSKASVQGVGVHGLALPDRDDAPAERLQAFLVRSIAFAVTRKFREPIILAGFGELAFRAAVPMPEAPMHEDRQTAAWQDDIRLSWQVLSVQSEAVAQSVQPATHDDFGAGALRPDRLHDPSSLFRAARVHRCAR